MHKLNLLPKEILISQNKKKLGLFCVLIASILLIFLTFIVVSTHNSIIFFENEIYKVHQNISEMKSKILDKNVDQKTLRDFETRQNFYNEATKNKTNYSIILNDIINLVPTEINVTSISIDKSNKIIINGYTTSHTYIALLMEELNTIDDILEVTLGFTRLLDAKDDDVRRDYDFEIIIVLAKDRLR